jgi:hypothetical protein
MHKTNVSIAAIIIIKFANNWRKNNFKMLKRKDVATLHFVYSRNTVQERM